MTDNEALARTVGLGAAWRDRRAEIDAAIATARRLAEGFPRPIDERTEPMPAFGVPQASAR